MPILNDEDVCAEMQAEELEVLHAIFPDYVSKDASGFRLTVPIQFGQKRQILVIHDGTNEEGASQPPLELTNLPPIILQITLPPDYPLHNPPIVRVLKARDSWLPRTRALRQLLLDTWESDSVLYNWIEAIRSAQFLEEMHLADSTGVIRIPHSSPGDLVASLSGYETAANFSLFQLNMYPCGVCLEDCKGTKCVQLSPCSHIFCRACLQGFWKLCVMEGAAVRCPDFECIKTEAPEGDVANVVDEEELKRWRWSRDKRELEKDPTIVYCPLEVCQQPVLKPKAVYTTDEELQEAECSGWARLRECSSCSFAFCAYCRKTWHGPISHCRIASTTALLEEYMAVEEGSARRKAIEAQYGQKNMKRMLARFEEDQANRDYLQANTVSCPGCQVHVTKSSGCNHMTCGRCNHHFCYRCGMKIRGQDPYKHFSTLGLPCYGQLFDLEDVRANNGGDNDGWIPGLEELMLDD